MNAKIASVLAALALGAACTGPAWALDVRDVGSFYIGGREAKLMGLPNRQITFTANAAPLDVNPNGDFEVEQMYVQYVRLSKPTAPYPVLLVHGGGMTGANWETKPDGKPGWQNWFLNNGYNVFISDAVERGRSGWARYPEIYKTEPLFRTKKEGWELFRMGPPDSYETRTPYPSQKFPLASFDQFAKQFVPRWVTNDAATIDNYEAYFRKVCPCFVVAHSQGGNLANAAALRVPELVKGIVLLEPSGSLDADKIDIEAAKKIPLLWVWGDNLRNEPHAFWRNQIPRIEAYREKLTAKGVESDWYELPKMKIGGNTHMLMMDDNSDEVAGLIDAWLRSKAKKSN